MKTLAIILAFFAGFLFCITYKHRDLVEGLEQSDLSNCVVDGSGGGIGGRKYACPNLLVKRGKYIYMLNKDKAVIPGINPVRFDNLEQYAEFLQYQRRMGIICPVLFLEEGFDAQNNRVWRASSDPFDPKGGSQPTSWQMPNTLEAKGDSVVSKLFDANIDNDPPANGGEFPGFDPHNQNLGKWTPLDKMFHSKQKYSNNPMDSNWRGNTYPGLLLRYYRGLPYDFYRSNYN